MTVFVRSERIFAVINMKYRNLVQPKNAVKFFHYLFVMIDDVVSCIIYMAGIKAHAEVFRIPHAVINRFKFFERTTNLAAFSCHCLQGNLHFHILFHYHIQSFDDLRDTGFFTRAHMGTRMENKCLRSHRFGSL